MERAARPGADGEGGANQSADHAGLTRACAPCVCRETAEACREITNASSQGEGAASSMMETILGPVGSVVYEPSPMVDDGPYPQHDYDRNQLISLLGGQRRIPPTLRPTEAETAHDTVAHELQHTARKYKAAFASRTPRLSKLAAYRTGNTRVGHFPGSDFELVCPARLLCTPARPTDNSALALLAGCRRCRSHKSGGWRAASSFETRLARVAASCPRHASCNLR